MSRLAEGAPQARDVHVAVGEVRGLRQGAEDAGHRVHAEHVERVVVTQLLLELGRGEETQRTGQQTENGGGFNGCMGQVNSTDTQSNRPGG